MNSVSKPSGVDDILALRQQILARSDTLRQINTPPAQDSVADASVREVSSQKGAASFAETLANAASEVSAMQKRSSDLSAAYERGEVTDITKVMLARHESGVAFEATLQLRNHLLKSYQEIMRMGG